MCICINCRHIDYCTTYSFIRNQHEEFSKNHKITFNPFNSIINVNVNKTKGQILIDWDLIECVSFVEKPGNWLTFF